ncbi:MAG TPA: ABC transporter ATP-binding protein [Dongiaceae bacterium]|nr:ABC transporter ATP-binding protein [Dongiaceae bacterium]
MTAGYDRRPAIHHLNVSIAPGSLFAVIGPNGGGKSTLLKTLMGLLVPMSGDFQFSPEASIAYLPQISELDRSFPMTVLDMVLMGAWPKNGFFRNLSGNVRSQAIRALEQVGMQAFAHRSIAALSTGQFQRALFARLLLQDAAIYFLDEPFSAIDTRTCADLLRIIVDWHRRGKTILCVLHDMAQVRSHFPHTMVLARELIGFGETAEVLSASILEEARHRAEEWHDHADECAIEPAVLP